MTTKSENSTSTALYIKKFGLNQTIKSGPNCTKCGLHFCDHDLIGCLKYTLNQPKSMVTNRKHKKQFVLLIALNMRAISSPEQWGPNGLHSAWRKDSIFEQVKIFYSFCPFYTKSITKSRKNWLKLKCPYIGHIKWTTIFCHQRSLHVK